LFFLAEPLRAANDARAAAWERGHWERGLRQQLESQKRPGAQNEHSPQAMPPEKVGEISQAGVGVSR
jgi:hypothetical protein